MYTLVLTRINWCFCCLLLKHKINPVKPQVIKISGSPLQHSDYWGNNHKIIEGVCPFQALKEYLSIQCKYSSDQEQFFIFNNGSPVKPYRFRNVSGSSWFSTRWTQNSIQLDHFKQAEQRTWFKLEFQLKLFTSWADGNHLQFILTCAGKPFLLLLQEQWQQLKIFGSSGTNLST